MPKRWQGERFETTPLGKRAQRKFPKEATHLRFPAEPGSELAKLRKEAHHAFDVYWEFYDTYEERNQARARAYRWLAAKLGLPIEACHFGMFGINTCRRALEICRTSGPT